MFKDTKNYIILGFIAVLFVVAGYFIFTKINGKELASNLIAGSGRIDGDLILLNTKYSGRIENIFVQNGEQIVVEQIVAKLKSKELISRAKGLESAVKSTQNERLSFSQTIEASKMKLQLLENTLPKLVQVKEENLKISNQNIKSIILKIEKLNLQYNQHEKEYKRYTNLFKTNSVSPEKFELVELKYKTTKKELESLKVEKEKILNYIQNGKFALAIEKENLAMIGISKQNIIASTTKLLALDNKIDQLIFNKEEIDAMIDELTIKSPVDGYVAQKISNIGEVVSSGVPIVTLIDPNSFYLKLFVDTIENGDVKIGDKAVVFLDSNPHSAIDAKVIRIEQKAEFTPKDVNVRSDRIQRMFAVHLKPIKVPKEFKLGLPAIGIISIDGNGLPKSLQEIPKI